MAEIIKDGSGTGILAKVDSTNKLAVRGVVGSENLESIENGDLHFLSTGLVTLTSVNASAIFFMKNDEINDLQITQISIGAGQSSNATTDFLIVSSLRNATGLSGSNPELTQINPNFGSAKILSITSEIGGEGTTSSGGTTGPSFFVQSQRTTQFNALLRIPKGQAFSISLTPPAGNTSISVAIAINLYLTRSV